MRGRLVAKGDLIAKVYDFKTVTAQIMISEREVEGIQVGQEVLLRARAYPSTLFHGIVTSIATSLQANAGSAEAPGASAPASAATGSKTLVVATRIDNPSLLLRPEMTGHAKVCCGPRRIVDLIRRRLARTFSVAVWSWW
jgi:multidrug resistance efflux pump